MTQGHVGPDAQGVGADGSLPRPPGGLRQFGARHPRLVDVGIALLCQLPTTIALILGATFTSDDRVHWVLASVASALSGVALLWRRSHPYLVALVCAALLAAPLQATMLANYAALYAVGAYSTRRKRWIAFAATAVATFVGPVLASLTWQDAIVAATSFGIFGIPSCLVALMTGISVRSRRDYITALIARGDDLQRERDQQAMLAAASERARIAREMHDVVSHGITMMVTVAEGAAAQAPRDAERAADAMRTVATTGRDALGEMRRLLGVLSEPDESASRAPQPEASDLAGLMDRFREAGLPVRWTLHGEPIEQRTLALAVHRIVQEALTNVLRHAHETRRVDVSIAHVGTTVRVTVEDDGPGAREGASAPGTESPSTIGAGRGIIGMRERAALHGGTVEAGPRAPRGWRVHVELQEESA